MAFQSPYRGGESLLSPKQREWLSRGALLLVGMVMAYVGLRGLTSISLGLLGLLTITAAVVPVSVMERIFSPLNRPPVTGDRDPDYKRLWLPWWMRWWR